MIVFKEAGQLLRIFIVEIVDTPEKIDAFVQTIDQAITEGMVTVERAQVCMYRARESKSS